MAISDKTYIPSPAVDVAKPGESRSTQDLDEPGGSFWQRSSARLTALFEPVQQKSTIVALDGVRAIACLLVVGYHVNLITRDTHVWLPTDHPFVAALLLAGEAGVTLFFVLSGFLLFLPYARALLLKSAWPSVRRFYLRRALRIIPAYYLCLFTLILLEHREYFQPDHWQQLGLFLVFFMDSSNATYQAINGPFWTLAVEWQFYLILPLLVLGIRTLTVRCAPERLLLAIALCLCAIIVWGMGSQAWSTYLLAHPLPDGIGWRIVGMIFFGHSGKYLQDFAVGMLVSLLYTYTRYADTCKRVKQALERLQPWLWSAGLALLLFIALWHENAAHGNGSPWLDALKGVYGLFSEFGFAAGFGLCILALLFGSVLVRKFFALTPLRWIGHVSYSTYMWHLPVLLCFMVYIGYNIASWNAWLVFGCYWLCVLLIILPFSGFAFIFTERPGMRLANKV